MIIVKKDDDLKEHLLVLSAADEENEDYLLSSISNELVRSAFIKKIDDQPTITEAGELVNFHVVTVSSINLPDLDRYLNESRPQKRRVMSMYGRHINSDILKNPSAWVKSPVLKMTGDYKTIANLIFNGVRHQVFLGFVRDSSYIRETVALIEKAEKWGDDALIEVLGLIYKFTTAFYKSEHLNRIDSDLADFYISDDGHTFLDVIEESKRIRIWSEHPYNSLDSSENGAKLVNKWLKGIESIFVNQWQTKFYSFSELGRKSKFESKILHKSMRDKSPLKDVFWLFEGGITDRIFEHLDNNEIDSASEFIDLATFDPPAGYKPLRRLSNTSAFKIVFSAEGPNASRVALKRYKNWSNSSMEKILSQLKLTPEDIIKKDSVTEWLGRIRHTNILPCSLVKNNLGEPFIIEPLLNYIFDNEMALSYDDLLLHMADISSAIKYLHKFGCIHSDIKPDNMGLQKDVAVLIDFGIASFNSNSKNNPGSVKTRAPELFSESVVPTSNSDVWSFGATLMYLFGKREYPFLYNDEIINLKPAGDPSRVNLERTIIERINTYRNEPIQFEKRIKDSLNNLPNKIIEAVSMACRLDPIERINANDLEKLLRSDSS